MKIAIYEGKDIPGSVARLAPLHDQLPNTPLSWHPIWLQILAEGLGHTPYCLEATEGDNTLGWLPLCYVRSLLFGRHLIGLPYLNYGGIRALDAAASTPLVDAARNLADRLNVRYLELRHDTAVKSPGLTEPSTHKVHMRLSLPETSDELWRQLDAKVRNQIRKAQKGDLAIHFGGEELLPEYFAVFSQNMRDLGTPTYPKGLFSAILRRLPGRAELAVARLGGRASAVGLLLHGNAITEVPSASSLREDRQTNSNMFLYWHMLERAVQRSQSVFDFGRSTVDGPTFRFKKQWGATPHPAAWQHYLRKGQLGELRTDNPKYQLMIRAWQRLPLWLSRLLGPVIVRGLP